MYVRGQLSRHSTPKLNVLIFLSLACYHTSLPPRCFTFLFKHPTLCVNQALDADVLVGHNIGAGDLTTLLYRLQHHKVKYGVGVKGRDRGLPFDLCTTAIRFRPATC